MTTQQQFLSLIEPLQPALYGFALRMLGSSEEARDALQELWYRLWKNRKRLKEQHNIKSYCFTAMHHLCIDELRRNKRFVGMDAVVDEIPAHSVIPSQAGISLSSEGTTIETSDLIAHIATEVKKLSYKQRLIIELHDFQEFTYQEIALMLDMEINAVRVNLSRARTRIAEKFNKEAIYEGR